MNTLLAVIVSYLIGSIPVGYLYARLVGGIDIRQHGSGNIGTTNVWRTLGPVPGVLVFLFDVGKGLAAVYIGRSLGGVETELLAALAVLCGHSWSIFLKFSGGKIIASAAGVVLAISPTTILVALIIWLAAVGVSRYVSLGSILGAVSVPFTMLFIGMDWLYVAFGAVFASIALYKHRSNMQRILGKTENKIGKGRRK